uniref:Uncharacterized protein n=1 Tax=Sphaerodactylus townsendi TaxID=933632 RepID=A0ACB8EGA8_9SAUR
MPIPPASSAAILKHSPVPPQRKVENRRQLIISEFEELHQFLEEEQQILLSRLEDEEKEILQKLKDNVTQLSEQRISLNSLITEIEEKCLQSGIEMLQVRVLPLCLPPKNTEASRWGQGNHPGRTREAQCDIVGGAS